MFFRSALIIAFASISQGFSPLAAPSRQLKEHAYRSPTRLFDSEQQSTAWSTEQYSKVSDTLTPTSDDLRAAAERAFSKKSVDKKKAAYTATKIGIESEYPKRKIKASVKETGYDSMKTYIKTMCNHELLKKNEEIILAREIQILLKMEEQREALEQQLLR
jgi:hypothetical protein